MPWGGEFFGEHDEDEQQRRPPGELALDLRRDLVDWPRPPVHRAEHVFQLHASSSANLHQPVELAVAFVEDTLHRRFGNAHALGKRAIGDAPRLQRPLQRFEDQTVHGMHPFFAVW